MIEEILESFNKSRGEYVPKQGNEYNITDLLMCRKKLELIREGKKPVIVENDYTRQAKISNFVHDSVKRMLEREGWSTNRKFSKSFGKYTLHMIAEGVSESLIIPGGCRAIEEIIEIKCPIESKKRISDYWLFQIQMYLNITGAEECILMVFAKNDFFEKVITGKMSDEDVIWLIENPKSPYFERECLTCWYKSYCDLEGGDKK